MGIHLPITSNVLPLFTMLFQKFVVSLTQFIYFVQTKIQILLYSIILSGGQLSGGQFSGGRVSIVGGSIVAHPSLSCLPERLNTMTAVLSVLTARPTRHSMYAVH